MTDSKIAAEIDAFVLNWSQEGSKKMWDEIFRLVLVPPNWKSHYTVKLERKPMTSAITVRPADQPLVLLANLDVGQPYVYHGGSSAVYFKTGMCSAVCVSSSGISLPIEINTNTKVFPVKNLLLEFQV